MSQIVLATAGHIDHGKTSLIHALTGISTDTTREEISRGITIDLGYAQLNDKITIIDVPGHEKFIKNMVAGAAGTHYALIVVAADDGIMPQTIEHIDILIALGVRKGYVAISKIDLIEDNEWIDLVKMEIKDFLSRRNFEALSINEIDSISGKGIEKIKNNILNLNPRKINNEVASKFRMNIDRVFTKDGFGLIVTGTVINGTAKVGDDLEVFPGKEILKIRSIQTHGKETHSVKIGDRAAINLKNKKKILLKRGHILASEGVLDIFSVAIITLIMNPNKGFKIKNRQRVKFYLGTSEVIGRIILCNNSILKKGQSDNAIIKLEKPCSAFIDDKFIIRSYSSMETLAGGIILEIKNKPYQRKLKSFAKKIPLDPKERFKYLVNMEREYPKTIYEWSMIFLNSEHLINSWIKGLNLKLTKKGNLIYSIESEKKSIKELIKFLDNYYIKNNLIKYVNDEIILYSIKWSKEWLVHIKEQLIDSNLIKLSDKGIFKTGHKVNISNLDTENLENIEKLLIESGKTSLDIQNINKPFGLKYDYMKSLIHFLQTKSLIVDIGNQSFLHMNTFKAIINEVNTFFDKEKTLSVSNFKTLTGLTRKVAIPLLECLDKNGYTKRVGNKRIIGEKLYD
jgi:selenocysteine-specific elongation factor